MKTSLIVSEKLISVRPNIYVIGKLSVSKCIVVLKYLRFNQQNYYIYNEKAILSSSASF